LPAPAATRPTDASSSGYFLKPLDPILVRLRSIPVPQDIEDVIDESGAINLPYLGRVQAAGKTGSVLEQEIQRLYLQKEIYKRVTVNVLIPSQSYYVRGEVRQPGRYPLISGVTILQAIAAAGGYTEFASPRKIKIIRGDKTFYRNGPELEKSPEKDEDVKSGDVIVVPRSVF
jgi:polysaccharide export outer membrane protein